MTRLAMVTGASSGIGEAFAERLAESGWNLVLVARRRDRLEHVAARLMSAHGVSARVVEADLADSGQLDALCAEVAETPLDMLVNNAALAHYMPFSELPAGPARELVQLNVLAPVLLTRAVLAGMTERGRGAVINVASLLAFSGSWEASAPSAARGVRGEQVVPRHLHADPGGRAARQRRAGAGRLPRGRALRVPLAPGGGPECRPEDGASRRRRRQPVRSRAWSSSSRSPDADVETALDGVDAAQRELMGFTRAVELPERYASSAAEPSRPRRGQAL